MTLAKISLSLTKGGNKCDHHKYGFWKVVFKKKTVILYLCIKDDIVQGIYFRRTRLVTRSTCTTRLVTHSTHLSNGNACLPSRSTRLPVYFSICSTFSPTSSICLSTRTIRNTICRSSFRSIEIKLSVIISRSVSVILSIAGRTFSRRNKNS